MSQTDESKLNLNTKNLSPENSHFSLGDLYIQQSDDILFVHCKANGEIIDSNKGFRKRFHFSQDSKENTLFSFLSFDSTQKASFEAGPEKIKGHPELLRDTHTQALLLFYVYQKNNEYFLFAPNNALRESRETELLSSLTTDMGNFLREESRTNRKLNEAYEKITKLSRTDLLTGILNHGYFMERAKEILIHAKRHKHAICLVMSDIDHFKKVNDNFGHQTGDTVLEGVGKILNTLTRAGDISARYGGEEFVTLLQDSNLEQAALFAERMRETFEASRPLGSKHPITISLGVAKLEADDSLESLVKKADDALYEAKATGRNKVCVN